MLGKLRSLVEEEKEVELYICCYSMPVDRYNTLYNITPTLTPTTSSSTNTHGHNNKNNKRGRNGNSNTHTNTTNITNKPKQHNEQGRMVKQFALFDCLSIDDMIR